MRVRFPSPAPLKDLVRWGGRRGTTSSICFRAPIVREQKRPVATCGWPAAGASHIASMVEYLDGPRVKNEPELDADGEAFTVHQRLIALTVIERAATSISVSA